MDTLNMKSQILYSLLKSGTSLGYGGYTTPALQEAVISATG